MDIKPDMTLYGKYRLKDLTITNTGLPNLPTTEQEFQNLVWLAKVLIQLEDSIGPFTVISAYRSAAVQDDVGAGAVAAGKKSFHELGLAGDIYPTTMSLDAYFGKILNSEWRQKLGEIIYKKSQNTIHISMPTSKIQGKLMFREPNGVYRLMTDAEIDELSGPYKMTYAPTEYGSNDISESIPDPSGGLYTDLFYGLYGRYSDVPSGSYSANDLPDYSEPISSNKSRYLLYGLAAAAAAALAFAF